MLGSTELKRILLLLEAFSSQSIAGLQANGTYCDL